MPRYPKPPLAFRVADQLSEEILSGQRRGQLPGIRGLMTEYRVSKNTMMLAIRRLEEYGYLCPAERGKARTIVPIETSNGDGSKKLARVLFITHRQRTQLYRTEFDVKKVLRKKVQQSGREFESIAYPEILKPEGVAGLSEFFTNNPADVYLVTRVHQQCARWLARSPHPIIYLGGHLAPECLPRVTYELEEMVSVAIEELVRLGHHRIVFIHPEEFMDSTLFEGDWGICLRIRELLKGYGVKASPYHYPRWGRSKREFRKHLKKMFQITPPTALVLSEPWMIPACLCFFIRNGIRYPEDVSLICLERSPLFEDCSPKISCIKKSIGNYTSKIISVIDEMLLVGSVSSQRTITAMTTFHKTKSIGKVKRDL